MKYKVDRFGYSKHWTIEDEKGKGYTAHETYNENCGIESFEVYDPQTDERIECKEKVNEIIDAVRKFEEESNV